MPFIPNTPESLVARSDSRNPATTCKGLNASGRPCRRSIGVSSPPSPGRPPGRAGHGVLAVLPSDSNHEGAAAFYCWQHKDQSPTDDDTGGGDGTTLHTLNERTSIDTLVDRLGVIDIDGDGQARKGRRKKQASRPVRKDTLPKKWQDVQGPLLALPHDGEKQRREKKRSSPGFLSLLCCMGSSSEAYEPPPPTRIRHSEKPEGSTPTSKVPTRPNSVPAPWPPLANKEPNRPFLKRDPPSQTQDLLSLIPKTLIPQTTSALLSELAKPVSAHDEEGYIYIFWLTPKDSSAPDSSAVISLLPDPSRPAAKARRASNTPASHGSGGQDTNKTILLKIGRASNVQRRMNEWTRQCGYALTLIRYYPYVPSSPAPSPLPSPSSKAPAPRSRSRPSSLSPEPLPSPSGQGTVRKVPHAHKVERLIHLELADKRVKKSCEACGKEHREWFELKGTRDGVKDVDDVVRRWVAWGERSVSADG